MANERYLFVVLDGRGRTLKRISISRRLGVGAAVLSGSIVLLFGVMGIHGACNAAKANESAVLREQNSELREALGLVVQGVPKAQDVASRAELTFSKIFVKSGLGRKPTALGVGPINDGDTQMTAAFKHRAVDVAPVAIPLEIDRVDIEGRRLQSSLDEILEYFHDAERLLSHTPSINPARSPWQTSSFGRRHDPMTGQVMMHKGIDLGGAIGTPIYAPADGVIIWASRRGGYGNTVVINHGFGLQTHFAHLSRYHVRVGDVVKRGQIIAEMGSTGKSTGPHLHYEVRRMGQPIDPATFVLD